MALGDYRTLVDDLVRDTDGRIGAASRDRAIGLAAWRYSSDRPRIMVRAMTADGGHHLALPADWESGFSRLVGVSIPAAGGGTATPVDAVLDQEPAGWRIRPARRIATGKTLHVRFTLSHVIDAGRDTVPERDREAVASWAAASVLEQMASLYSGHGHPTIAADAVDWQSKGRDYALRAKRMREIYFRHLGIVPERTNAAGVMVDWNRGRGRLIRRAGRR